MSDRMRPLPFRQLVLRCLAEYRAVGSIFDIPEAHFWKPARVRPARIFSSSAANPVGPAAGPHTQLAQNIAAAWCAGGRYFELKTVQKLDSLTVEKPCIDAADEGYNVEWSTELSLDEAYDEYLKAWMLLHLLEELLGHSGSTVRAGQFMFNMSVGYDLAGIRTEKMDRFINRLIDSTNEPLFSRYREELARIAADSSLLSGAAFQPRRDALRGLPSRISPRLCASVTLSTMHGCPPGEIESICAYMLSEKRLDTLVKLNPTLLGYERAHSILAQLGYGYVQLKPEGFLKDLQYADAVPMLTRLMALGRKEGRVFRRQALQHPRRGKPRGGASGCGDVHVRPGALSPHHDPCRLPCHRLQGKPAALILRRRIGMEPRRDPRRGNPARDIRHRALEAGRIRAHEGAGGDFRVLPRIVGHAPGRRGKDTTGGRCGAELDHGAQGLSRHGARFRARVPCLSSTASLPPAWRPARFTRTYLSTCILPARAVLPTRWKLSAPATRCPS